MGGRGQKSASEQDWFMRQEVELDGWDGEDHWDLLDDSQLEDDVIEAIGLWLDDSTLMRNKDSFMGQEQAEILEGYIRESDGVSTPLFRGVALSPEITAQLKPGAIIDQGGLSSWSKELDVARDYARGNAIRGNGEQRVVFRARDGLMQSADLSMYNTTDKEVVASNLSAQRVLAVAEHNGVLYVDVEDIAYNRRH